MDEAISLLRIPEQLNSNWVFFSHLFFANLIYRLTSFLLKPAALQDHDVRQQSAQSAFVHCLLHKFTVMFSVLGR